MNEFVVGLDPHKLSNTIAVLDRDENVLARRRFDNTVDGLPAMLDAVGEYPDRLWAVEGANGIGRSIAQRLVAIGSWMCLRSWRRGCGCIRPGTAPRPTLRTRSRSLVLRFTPRTFDMCWPMTRPWR